MSVCVRACVCVLTTKFIKKVMLRYFNIKTDLFASFFEFGSA